MLALRPWVDGIEFDVRLTADSVPVLMHDRDVDRTTDGEGRVAEYTLKEIKRLNAGAGERVPTVAEFLKACEQRQWRRLLLDMKDTTNEAFSLTAELVEASPLIDDCIIMVRPSEDQAVRFRMINDRLRLGGFRVTVDNMADVLPSMVELGGELVLTDPNAYLRHRGVVAAAHEIGLDAGSSTNNVPESLRAAVSDGCTVILTDISDDLKWL